MTTKLIIALRDELARSLRNREGVSGVGIGRDNGHYVLIVSVDPDRLSGALPTEFKGVVVRQKDLTDAEFHSAGSRRKSDGRAKY
ncbi:MAG: hypothetical protein ACFCD0_13495 [Gemmataceae bacterium]